MTIDAVMAKAATVPRRVRIASSANEGCVFPHSLWAMRCMDASDFFVVDLCDGSNPNMCRRCFSKHKAATAVLSFSLKVEERGIQKLEAAFLKGDVGQRTWVPRVVE